MVKLSSRLLVAQCFLQMGGRGVASCPLLYLRMQDTAHSSPENAYNRQGSVLRWKTPVEKSVPRYSQSRLPMKSVDSTESCSLCLCVLGFQSTDVVL